MPIVTLGITGFHEILGRVYGIETRDSGFSGRDSGLKVYVGGEMPIVTLGIRGFLTTGLVWPACSDKW